MIYIFAVGILIVFVFWMISVQRSFVILDENTNNAMAQIAVQLSSRWDALIALLDLTKSYGAHDFIGLAETIKARRSISRDASPEEVIKQEKCIVEAISKIMAAAECYPDLKADQTYIKKMDAVHQYENMIRTSSLIYNDSVAKLNRVIRMFPSSIVAVILGFSKRAYLESEEKSIYDN